MFLELSENSAYLLQDPDAEVDLLIRVLIKEHYEGLYRLCKYHLEVSKDAHLAAMNVIAEAVRQRNVYLGQASVTAWLYGLALRTLPRKPKRPSQPSPDPLCRTLNRYPTKEQLPFLLRYWDNLSLSEIAYILRRREGRIEHAINDLRRWIGQLPIRESSKKAEKQFWHVLDTTTRDEIPEEMEFELEEDEGLRDHLNQLRFAHRELFHTLTDCFPVPAFNAKQAETIRERVTTLLETESPSTPQDNRRWLWGGAFLAVLAIVLIPVLLRFDRVPSSELFPGAAPTLLPNTQDAHAEQPALSADGRWVALVSTNPAWINELSGWLSLDVNDQPDVFLVEQETGLARHWPSTSSDFFQANGTNLSPSVDAVGRYVVFASRATNLDPKSEAICRYPDQPDAPCANIYLRDNRTQTTTRLTRALNDGPADADSYSPTISANGQWVIFWSGASNLVPDDVEMCGPTLDRHNCIDLFVFHIPSGEFQHVPIGRAKGDSPPLPVSVTNDGQLWVISMQKDDQRAVELEQQHQFDLYLYDRSATAFSAINQTMDGERGNASALVGAISGQGNAIAFASAASNLVSQDTNGRVDVFVWDRLQNTLGRITIADDGVQSNGHSGVRSLRQIEQGEQIRLTDDGQFVVFPTRAANLMGDGAGWWCRPIPRGTGACASVILHDRVTAENRPLISAPAPNQRYLYPNISRNGDVIVYAEFVRDCETNCAHVWRFLPDTNETFLLSPPFLEP